MPIGLSKTPRALMLVSAWTLLGCEERTALQSTPLLAEAPTQGWTFSAYEPKNPYHEVAENLLARTVFQGPGTAGLNVELRDLLVPAGTVAAHVSLPGVAVLQVLSGEGSIAIDGASQELTMGKSLALEQHVSCDLTSRGVMPLVVRARIFGPSP